MRLFFLGALAQPAKINIKIVSVIRFMIVLGISTTPLMVFLELNSITILDKLLAEFVTFRVPNLLIQID